MDKHTIRTYKNKSMLGKSSYTNWDEGIYKMLYIGGKKLSDLATDHNISTFKGS